MRLRDAVVGALTVPGRMRPASGRALAEVRREHDDWARSATAGTTYYTALPTGISGGMRGNTHVSVVFAKRASWGMHTGQWITADNLTTSWRLWFQYGPLTTTQQWTHVDQAAHERKVSDAFEQGMEASVTRRFLADHPEIGRQYPATVGAFAGAR